ncbi:MAG: YlmC/YmxH family sporulation protein [Clostridia bacterium]|nr:YlmC/YmxH family sporulation protein [Clostridia bacterium]MBO7666389.1 YlmC/YmxH family sporulation protein [Clostridia bacterium]MBP5657801.1 YlmC/YmxH family sporulation protein [Clostridia bacterium]
MCSFSDLRDKEVINLRDGRKLGCVMDIDFDIPTGRICRIILPPPGKMALFASSKSNLYIPWDKIEKIGDDAILVRCADVIIPKKEKPPR